MRPRLLGILLGTIFWALSAPGAEGAPAAYGQWIWSPQDARIFDETSERIPGLIPSPWLATFGYSDGRIAMKLALSPGLAPRGPIAAVLRFDESFHRAWEGMTAAELAAQLEAKLAELSLRIAGAGGEVREWQLDYDCPRRRLPDWSETLKRLAAGALKDRPLWITSLVSHLADPEFGRRLQGTVAGHILQVFDTGESPERHPPDLLSARLTAQNLPFRLGLGAFERSGPVRPVTEHRAWFAALPAFSNNPWYRGLWVFPGGRRWVSLLPATEVRP